MERACGTPTRRSAGGLEAVVEVVRHADNGVKSGAARGAEAVVDVVRRHRDGPAALLERACGALRNITLSVDSQIKCGG